MLAVRIGCLAAAALLIVAPVAHAMATVLTSAPCRYDPLYERSEFAAMVIPWIGAVLLLWAAWRPRVWLIAVALALPLAALLFHVVVAKQGRPAELACRARPLPQALAVCGERIDRYTVDRSWDIALLRLRPGMAKDERFVCMARWAEWSDKAQVYPR